MLVTSSCNHVYKKYDKEAFPAYTWKSGQEIAFQPIINEVKNSYTLIIGVRHLYGFKSSTIHVAVRTISPSGNQIVKEYTLKVKDDEGKYLAKCGGDLCDLETVVEDNLQFDEQGQYHILIAPTAKNVAIPGILEVGLIIDESQKHSSLK
jgi:gliding motility-associated lipoprotein GldH